MAGKSTLLEALLWCLFGRTLRGLKHDQIVNRKSKNGCFVEVTFSVENIRYRVCRYRKHKVHKNSLHFFRGTQPLHSRHEIDTQAKIESILGVDFQAFVNSTVFGGFDGGRKQFALLTDKEQKRIFDSFLRFEKFEEALDFTKNLLFDSKEKLAALHLQTEKQRSTVRVLQSKIKTLERTRRVFRKHQRKKLRGLHKQLHNLPEVEQVSSQRVKQLRQKLEEYISERAATCEKERQTGRKLNRIATKQANREKMVGKPCPACGQLVKAATLSSLLRHLKRDREKLRSRRQALMSTIAEQDRRVLNGRNRLKRLTKLQDDSKTLHLRREELERSIQSLKSPTPLFTSELEETSLQYALQTSRLLVNSYEITALQARIRDLQFWEEGFGNKGVKTVILKEVLPAMNQKLREFASELFQTQIELEFKPSKENKSGESRELFHLHYKSRRNGGSYVAESSGGRRRVDICVLLVFSWMSRCSNLLLVDELLDGLDENGRESILRLLVRQRQDVLLITHEKGLKSQIGKVWTVRKRNGESTLETAA